MKAGFFRILLGAVALVLAVALVSPASVSASVSTQPDDEGRLEPVPWWDKTHLHAYYYGSYPTETLVSSLEITGTGATNVYWVNLRGTPSVYGYRVRKIRKAGTEVTLTALVTNSSGQEWFAVRMSDGTFGYIRSDLLNANYQYVTPEEPENQGNSDDEEAKVTPQVIYVTPEPTESNQPTPTPILVYITPEPNATPQPEVTPQVIYIYQDDEHG